MVGLVESVGVEGILFWNPFFLFRNPFQRRGESFDSKRSFPNAFPTLEVEEEEEEEEEEERMG